MSSEVSSLKSEVLVLRSLCESALTRVTELEERVQRLEAEREETKSWTRVSSAGSADSARGSSLEVDKEDQSSRRRRQLAVEIGQFLRRALNGEHRGSSGRDRLKLANRCYLILADFRGRRLPKPICSDSFQDVRNLCKIGADVGDSIFCGFATKWDAKVACLEAGVALPESLRNV